MLHIQSLSRRSSAEDTSGSLANTNRKIVSHRFLSQMLKDSGQKVTIEIVDSLQKSLNHLQVGFVKQWGEHFFGSLPMTTQYSWTGPTETRFNIFVYKGDEIVSRLRIVSRNAQINGESVEFGGIGGVMTVPAQQRNGFATLALCEAERLIFQSLNARLGMLLCLHELVTFYERFGWRRVECPVMLEQPNGKVIWSESAMFLPKLGEIWRLRAVDLCGLPF
jgi:RimJ/RimL family protein N-acetyltransferase